MHPPPPRKYDKCSSWKLPRIVEFAHTRKTSCPVLTLKKNQTYKTFFKHQNEWYCFKSRYSDKKCECFVREITHARWHGLNVHRLSRWKTIMTKRIANENVLISSHDTGLANKLNVVFLSLAVCMCDMKYILSRIKLVTGHSH